MHKKYLLLFPLLIALSSCGGFSLDYIVEGDKYISSNFLKNYYEHWDDELANAARLVSYNVDDSRITSFKQIGNLDPNYATANPDSLNESKLDAYSHAHMLINYNESFKYGVQSKLFDGRFLCDGLQQRSRIQIRENKGFSVRFSKESDGLSYFAMNFKTTLNNQTRCYKVDESEHPVDVEARTDSDKFHSSVIQLTVTIFVKQEGYIIGYDFVSTLDFDKCYCNYDRILRKEGESEDPEPSKETTNNGSIYYFYGFDLSKVRTYNNEPLSRMVGFSINYKVISDKLNEFNEGKYIDGNPVEKMDYAIFLYEVYLPYTYWH